jgi:hypothetical protein
MSKTASRKHREQPTAARKAAPGNIRNQPIIDAPISEPAVLQKPLIRLLSFIIGALIVAFAVQFGVSKVAETDLFYHFFHARMYAQHGLFHSDFPWLVLSVVGKYGADIWYGFHILLVPFTYIPDPIARLKLGGVFIMFVAMLLFYLALRHSRIAFPFLWPLLAVFAAGLVTWRFSMVRPHVLSVGLSVLLLALLVNRPTTATETQQAAVENKGKLPGFSSSRKFWAIMAVSFGLVWIHLALFWLAALVTLVVIGVQAIITRKIAWQSLLAAGAGIILGWLLRPNPIGALKILYVQVFMLMFEKQAGTLRFARELYPPLPEESTQFLIFSILLGVCVLWFLWKIFDRRSQLSPRVKVLLWSSGLLSILFGVMTFAMSLRTADQWAPSSFFFIAGCVSYLPNRQANRQKTSSLLLRSIGVGLGGVLAIIMVILSALSYRDTVSKVGVLPQRLRGAGEWLRDHAKPTDIALNLDTDAFGELAYWGAPNRFSIGMDTIFTYAYSKDLFWKSLHISSPPHIYGKTWGKPFDTNTNLDSIKAEDLYTVLRRDFHADYVILRKHIYERPGYYTYVYMLEDTKQFAQLYDRDDTVIMEVLKDKDEGGKRKDE